MQTSLRSLRSLSTIVNIIAKLFSLTNIMEDLELEYATTRPWAFTLRRTKLKLGPLPNDYIKHMNKICQSLDCKITDQCFEYTGGIHMHGIIQIPAKTYMDRFRVRGWKMHLEEIYDLDGWRRYMQKEQHLLAGEETLLEKFVSALDIGDAFREVDEEYIEDDLSQSLHEQDDVSEQEQGEQESFSENCEEVD